MALLPAGRHLRLMKEQAEAPCSVPFSSFTLGVEGAASVSAIARSWKDARAGAFSQLRGGGRFLA